MTFLDGMRLFVVTTHIQKVLKSPMAYGSSTVGKDRHSSAVATEDISSKSGIRFWQEWDNMCVSLPYQACVFKFICARCLIECNAGNERVHSGFISPGAFSDRLKRFPFDK